MYIVKGVELGQVRLLQRAIRQNAHLRKHISREVLLEAVQGNVPTNSPSFAVMKQCIELLPATLDDASSSSGGSGSSSGAMDVADDAADVVAAAPPTSALPEVEVYLFTLVVTTLLRHALDGEAAFAATALVERIRSFNRRSLDLFSSKAFFYFSLSFERTDKLDNARATLLTLYRTACVRRDEMSQAVLLNLLLRNYLHYNLVEQAQTLMLRSSFPENVSNNQFCRYLYYLGRVQAVQLEYSAAYQRLTVAARKAPQDHSVGFSREVHKLTILVQLLMGDVPERSLFNQQPHRRALAPYLSLAQSVRNGDVNLFQRVVTEHGSAFRADKNFTLVERLGHNVLKTGLRKISLSYSRITLADVAAKLHLPSVVAAEYVCAKAIRDGVIDATLDHANGFLLSNDQADLYSTVEPQKAFHKFVCASFFCSPSLASLFSYLFFSEFSLSPLSPTCPPFLRRIAFTLDVHNEAIKAMKYPPDAYRKVQSSSDKDKDKKDAEPTDDELAEMLEDDE